MRIRARIVFALLAAALAGCARHNQAESTAMAPSSADAAQVEVQNRSSYDMDIYLVRNGQRTRIGFAPANKSTGFTVSRAMAAGVGMTRLEAHPIRGGAEVIQSDPVAFYPGTVVTFPIPPQ
jgi:hypothetical protein